MLILLFTDLLTIPFASQCFFHTLLFTWLQIKRMTLDFLDDVFGLHLALEAPQGILKGFAFLYSNLCQKKYTSKHSLIGILLEYSCSRQKHYKLSASFCHVARSAAADHPGGFGVKSVVWFVLTEG